MYNHILQKPVVPSQSPAELQYSFSNTCNSLNVLFEPI